MLRETKKKQLLAVYGTLKEGYSNHEKFLNKKPLYKGIVYNYILIGYEIPFAIRLTKRVANMLEEQMGIAPFVMVEVYDVTPEELQQIDRLEQHPIWYVRKKVDVHLLSDSGILPLDTEVTKAWFYDGTTAILQTPNPSDKQLIDMLQTFYVLSTNYEDMLAGIRELNKHQYT